MIPIKIKYEEISFLSSHKEWGLFVDGQFIAPANGKPDFFKACLAADIPEPAWARLHEFYSYLSGASFHFADDSGKEWGLARECQNKAKSIRASLEKQFGPEITPIINELAKGQLAKA